jgi:hypothetical protein
VTTSNTCKRLTIFEGCDGTGKSTAAEQYAKATGARLVHFPALPRVHANLGRMYVEAMLPALLGYQDVVFDRCWLSEEPYGVAFREGQDRLGVSAVRMLERLAYRCGAVVVRCNPGWDAVVESYKSRKHLEMLKDTAQLEMVYEGYNRVFSYLPEVHYDYRHHKDISSCYDEITGRRQPTHRLDVATAGNYGASVFIVGDTFAERKDNDAFYQWPFASFSRHGCSQWLTYGLEMAGIGEDQLMWVNADQDLMKIHPWLSVCDVIALGNAASSKLKSIGIRHQHVSHPQAHKRFNMREPYPLFDIIRG